MGRVSLEPRSIRIGSVRESDFSIVQFTPQGVNFSIVVDSKHGNTQIHLEPSHITQVLIHPGMNMPVIFLQIDPAYAIGLHETCAEANGINVGAGVFDPTEDCELSECTLVILLNVLMECKDKLLRIFRAWPPHDKNQQREVREIGLKAANAMLIRNMPGSSLAGLYNYQYNRSLEHSDYNAFSNNDKEEDSESGDGDF